MGRSKAHNSSIKKVDEAYTISNKPLIARIEEILSPEDVKLPVELQAQLEKFNDNPVGEKEKALVETKLLKDLQTLALGDLKIDDFSMMHVAIFARRVQEKITSFKDKEGYFKDTEATRNMKLPTSSTIQKMEEKASKIHTEKMLPIIEELKKYTKEESFEENIDRITVLNKELEKHGKAMKDGNIKALGFEDLKLLTEWEQDLVNMIASEYIQAVRGYTIENPTLFTPFAKYTAK